MASFSAYPPFVMHATSSRPLDVSAAHAVLSSFLQLANLDPAYRPDSTLSERGPEANSSSSNPNLTLHHLNRIKLGLEGINLGIEDIDAGLSGERNARSNRQGEEGVKGKWQDRDGRSIPFTAGPPKVMSTADEDGDVVMDVQDTNERDGVDGEGWQDRQHFELAQDDQDVDVNNAERDPTAASIDGMCEDIVEAKTVMVTNLNDEFVRKEGQVETVGADDGIDAQSAEEERSGPPAETRRMLTREEKEERKRLKRIRSKEEKPTAIMAKAKERSKESKVKDSRLVSKDEPRGTSSRQKEKKKRSKIKEQP